MIRAGRSVRGRDKGEWGVCCGWSRLRVGVDDTERTRLETRDGCSGSCLRGRIGEGDR
jgi:hypothetical protein